MELQGPQLLVDHERCEGFGFCEQAAPELLHLDEEGELVIHVSEVPEELEDHALAAVDACPVTALRLRGSSIG